MPEPMPVPAPGQSSGGLSSVPLASYVGGWGDWGHLAIALAALWLALEYLPGNSGWAFGLLILAVAVLSNANGIESVAAFIRWIGGVAK
jgi:hypothetical protein